MLLLGGGDGCGGGTNRALSGIPRVSGGACGGASGGWSGVVNNLFKICFREVIF